MKQQVFLFLNVWKLRSREFQANDSDGDKRSENSSGDRESLSKQENAGNKGANTPDTGPNGVSRS